MLGLKTNTNKESGPNIRSFLKEKPKFSLGILATFLFLFIATGSYLVYTSMAAELIPGKKFVENFTLSEYLYETSVPAYSKNPNWWVKSGAKMVSNYGTGKTSQGNLTKNNYWRKVYEKSNPVDTENGFKPQNVFMILTRSQWRDGTYMSYFKLNKYNTTTSANRNFTNGMSVLARYRDNNNYYKFGFNVDGNIVVTKKVNGTEYTLSKNTYFAGTYNSASKPNLIPVGYMYGIKAVFTNNLDGSVNIKLYADQGGGNWQLVNEIVDNGSIGLPIRNEGYAGIKTDFMDAEFDGFTIEAPVVAEPPVSDTTAPAISYIKPTSLATVSGLVDNSVSATDASGIAKVEFFVDDTLKTSQTVPGTDGSYGYGWDSKSVSDGTHILKAKATDKVGNFKEASVSVVVKNTVTTTPPPTTTPSTTYPTKPTTTEYNVNTYGIQNAINLAAGKGHVYFPDGTYTTSNLIIPSNSNIYLAPNAKVTVNGESLKVSSASNVLIQGGIFTNATTSYDTFQINGSKNVTMNYVTISGGVTGVVIVGSDTVLVTNSKFYNNSREGILAWTGGSTPNTYITASNNYIDNFGFGYTYRGGIHFYGAKYAYAYNNTVKNGAALTYGIRFRDTQFFECKGNTVEKIGDTGIAVHFEGDFLYLGIHAGDGVIENNNVNGAGARGIGHPWVTSKTNTSAYARPIQVINNYVRNVYFNSLTSDTGYSGDCIYIAQSGSTATGNNVDYCGSWGVYAGSGATQSGNTIGTNVGKR